MRTRRRTSPSWMHRDRRRLGDDLGARDRGRDAHPRRRDVRLGAVGEPRGPRGRAVAPRRSTPVVDAVTARRSSAEDQLRRPALAGRRRRRGRRRRDRPGRLPHDLDPQRRDRDRGAPRLALQSRAAPRRDRAAAARGLHTLDPRPLRPARRRGVLAGDLSRIVLTGVRSSSAGDYRAGTGHRRRALRRPRGRPAGDHEVRAAAGDGDWIATAARHWNVDRDDPR